MSQVKGSLQKDELWKVLMETVHALPMYKNHKRYLQDVMLKERPEITAQELAVQFNVTLGEALVLLEETRITNPPQAAESETKASKPSRTLLDFGS